jgi:hypothetical protein
MDSNPFSNPSILSALQKTLKLHSNRVGTAIESHRNILPVLIINNVYVSPEHGRCEEERRCFDFDCPLNKTTWESLQAEGVLSRRSKKPQGWRPATIEYNRKPGGGLHDFSRLVSDRGGLIVREPKRRKQA